MTPVFEGDEAAVLGWIRSVSGFYVYELRAPNDVPIYVGEGVDERVLEHLREARRGHRIGESNPYKCNKIRSILAAGGELKFVIDSLHPTKERAQSREAVLIRQYGRACDSGPLTNLHGGHGNPHPISPETIEARKETLSGFGARDADVRALNIFIAGIDTGLADEIACRIRSNPIKPRRVYTRSRISWTRGTTGTRDLTFRTAAALVASASCNGGRVEAWAEIPRAFTYNGIHAVIENGAANDFRGSGAGFVKRMGDDPSAEVLVLNDWGASRVRSLLGSERFIALGLE